MKGKHMDNIAPEIFLIGICAFVGIISFLVGWNSMKKNQAAAAWPTVKGKIISSVLESYISYDDEGDATTMYRPVITYEFEVDGEVYTSTQVRVSGFAASNLERSQRKKLAAYPEGGEVVVHYNPYSPQDALLEINPSKINLGMVIGIIGGIATLYFAFRLATSF
jgi:hypothetical protein